MPPDAGDWKAKKPQAAVWGLGMLGCAYGLPQPTGLVPFSNTSNMITKIFICFGSCPPCRTALNVEMLCNPVYVLDQTLSNK